MIYVALDWAQRRRTLREKACRISRAQACRYPAFSAYWQQHRIAITPHATSTVSLRAGQRAAAIMSLLHTARLNGHETYVYLKDVLERLTTQPASALAELLPYHWKPPA